MINQFFTYLLTLTLLITLTVPSYILLTEEICDICLVSDAEGGETDSKESSEKTEFKIINSPIDISINVYSINSQKNIHKITQYNSIYKKLESPPPKYS